MSTTRIALLPFFLSCGFPVLAGEFQSPLATIEDGRELFVRDWSKGSDATAPQLAEGGNGLGPMHNHVSCAGCHKQGGIGGGGSNDVNVDILTSMLPGRSSEKPLSPAAVRSLEKRAAVVHPAFFQSASFVLHRFGFDADGGAESYAEFRDQLLGDEPFRLTRENHTRRINNVTVRLSQRNTPSLFGAGAIDAIPLPVLIQLAATQKIKHPKMAGRFTAKFGWQGDVASVRQFVIQACAGELGLRVERHAKESPYPLDGHGNPLPGQPLIRTMIETARAAQVDGKKLPTFDLNEIQMHSLVRFISNLKPPKELAIEEQANPQAVEAGRELFHHIGCSVCHVPDIDSVKGLYSDLLLHDMGKENFDPIQAPHGPLSLSSHASMYLGRRREVKETLTGTIREQEYRTPALWGCRDSAPYMHDGRAKTIEEAIRCHGGQATQVMRSFDAMNETRKHELIQFVLTIGAPDVKDLPERVRAQ